MGFLAGIGSSLKGGTVSLHKGFPFVYWLRSKFSHQYSHNFLVGACTGLYKPVQALKVESLQEKQAMSDCPQVWFHFARQALIGLLHIIYMIRSSFIYFSNMAQDRERAFVCCYCCHHHWQRQWHFHVYVMSSSLNNVLSWQFYLISALNLFVSHASSCGPHMASESWHLGKMAHLWACQQSEKPKKAASFLSFCWCSLI